MGQRVVHPGLVCGPPRHPAAYSRPWALERPRHGRNEGHFVSCHRAVHYYLCSGVLSAGSDINSIRAGLGLRFQFSSQSFIAIEMLGGLSSSPTVISLFPSSTTGFPPYYLSSPYLRFSQGPGDGFVAERMPLCEVSQVLSVSLRH